MRSRRWKLWTVGAPVGSTRMAPATNIHALDMTTEFSESLTTAQFAAMAAVARLDSPALRDAMRRIVLVGAQRLDVAMKLGVGKAPISYALSRLRGDLSIAHAALQGRGGPAPIQRKSDSEGKTG